MRRRWPWAGWAWLLPGAVIAVGAGALGARLLHAPAPPAAGPIEIGFAQAMSLHHHQAIAMAEWMLDGRPTPLAGLARRIATTQLIELGEMRGWLRLWGASLRPPARRMDWMLLGSTAPGPELLRYLLDCERSPAGMVGMATEAELDALRRLEGRARDRRFLELMLAHHEGGLPMARFAAVEARLPVVRELAERVVLEQSLEIQRMRQTLAAVAAADPH